MNFDIINKIISSLKSKDYLLESIENFIQKEKYILSSGTVSGKLNLNIIKGENNIVLRGRHSKTLSSKISINGSNNIIILSGHSHLIGADIRITGNNNLFYIGAFSTSGSMVILLEGMNRTISIGDFCMLSNRIMMDSSDHHSIYDLTSKRKINDDADIHIKNHVWIGRDVKISKGTKIENDVIIGQGALVSGTLINNAVYGGVPAKLLKDNVTWSRMKSESLNEMESTLRHKNFLRLVDEYKKLL